MLQSRAQPDHLSLCLHWPLIYIWHWIYLSALGSYAQWSLTEMSCSEVNQMSSYCHVYLRVLQALEWIHDTGEFYLSTHTSTGSSIHHTQELLKEHEDFHITAKVTPYFLTLFLYFFLRFSLIECKGCIDVSLTWKPVLFPCLNWIFVQYVSDPLTLTWNGLMN